MIITIMATVYYDTIKCYKYSTINANEVNVATGSTLASARREGKLVQIMLAL